MANYTQEDFKEFIAKEELAIRAQLREFDDARRGWMLRQWAKVSNSPQKVGYLALGLAMFFLVLGWMIG